MDTPLNRFSNYYKDRLAEAQDYSRMADDIESDLKKKLPGILGYFKKYDPESVEEVLNRYAHRRFNFTKLSKYYVTKAEDIQLGYYPEAENFLKQIMYKMLPCWTEVRQRSSG